MSIEQLDAGGSSASNEWWDGSDAEGFGGWRSTTRPASQPDAKRSGPEGDDFDGLGIS